MPSETMGGSLEQFSPLLKAGQQNTTKKNIFETNSHAAMEKMEVH